MRGNGGAGVYAEPITVAWSGGKDSALALARIMDTGAPVNSLLTTITHRRGAVCMHGIDTTALRRQAAALGLPVLMAPVGATSLGDAVDQRDYSLAMASILTTAPISESRTAVFGDIFGRAVRDYREQRLSRTSLTPVFPLWGEPTSRLAGELLERGIKAMVVCVDTRYLDPDRFLGVPYDSDFLTQLPAGVDPCGEFGEFHTFVYDAPYMNACLDLRPTDVVVTGFCAFQQYEVEVAGGERI